MRRSSNAACYGTTPCLTSRGPTRKTSYCPIKTKTRRCLPYPKLSPEHLMKKILILGAGGQLGSLLVAAAPAHVQLSAANSAEIDISNAEQVRLKIAAIQPDVVINAAAYTEVDKAEAEPGTSKAWAVNQ